MKYLFFLILFLFSQMSRAQFSTAKPFADSISATSLRTHLFIIASAEMEGRETTTAGQRKAAVYIENHFRQVGLKPGWNGNYQQNFPIYRDTLASVLISINNNVLKNDTDYSVVRNSGYQLSVDGSEIVFAGYGRSDSIRNDYSGIDSKGKVVLVIPGAPPQLVKGKKVPTVAPDLESLQEAAGKNGVAALLIINPNLPQIPEPVMSKMYLPENADNNIPPTFMISHFTAEMIMGKDFAAVKKIIKEGIPVTKKYSAAFSIKLDKQQLHLESSNVIGVLEGTDKKSEALVITAHYDHMGKRDSMIFYGADDDGSGTVSVLKLADAFTAAAAAGKPSRRTIIFMTVSGEEKGLWGSEYYSEHPAFPMDSTSANINIDMIGRVESGRKVDSLSYIYVIGDNRLSSDLRPISEAANKAFLNFTLDDKFNDPNDPQRIYYRSDHYNFAKKGVPAVFYFSGLHDDYHRTTDTPDKINYELLAKRAQLIFFTAWEIANRDEMLKRDGY